MGAAAARCCCSCRLGLAAGGAPVSCSPIWLPLSTLSLSRSVQSNAPLPPLPYAPTAQDVDFAVGRLADEASYDLDVGQRVFVEVPPAAMMAFDYPDIDASASAP